MPSQKDTEDKELVQKDALGRKLEPRALIRAVRMASTFFLILCFINNQEMASCYVHMLLLIAALVKAQRESQILLIVLSLPVLQVSDDLIGVTCS